MSLGSLVLPVCLLRVVGSAVAGTDLALAQRLQDVFLGAVRDDLAVVDDQQAVDQGQQRAAVGDQEQRLALQCLADALLEGGLGGVVHGAGGLVRSEENTSELQ